MADQSDDLRRHEKVVAAKDIPGVPVGTKGKVFLVDGITWIRYRVLFDNGVEIGSLNRSVLMRRKEWDELEQERRAEERAAALEPR